MTVPNSDLIIFDLDGTLVDSVQQIIKSVNIARINSGMTQRNPKEIFNLVGLPPTHFFSDLNIDDSEMEMLVRSFRNTLEQTHFTSFDVYPSVRDLLFFLREKGFSLGVATNKPTKNAMNLLEKVCLLDFFSVVQGSDDLNPKPSPQIINRVLSSAQWTFAVMVGDRTEDIQAAKSAGIPSIGVSHTAHNQEELANAGAELTFSCMKDLFKSVTESSVIDTLRA